VHTTDTGTVGYGWEGAHSMGSTSLTVPMCVQCKRHEEEYVLRPDNVTSLAFCVCAPVGALVGYLGQHSFLVRLPFVAFVAEAIGALLVGGFLANVLFSVLNRLLPYRCPLSPTCASVRPTDLDKVTGTNRLKFTFRNLAWGEQFANLNHLPMTVEKSLVIERTEINPFDRLECIAKNALAFAVPVVVFFAI